MCVVIFSTFIIISLNKQDKEKESLEEQTSKIWKTFTAEQLG